MQMVLVRRLLHGDPSSSCRLAGTLKSRSNAKVLVRYNSSLRLCQPSPRSTLNQRGHPALPVTQVRGAKIKTTLKLRELPQGALPVDTQDLVHQDAAPEYPTVLQQARNNMIKFNHAVLLTRVGGFYELYFEHADIYGPLLNLRVSKKKTASGPISMAGFPYFQLDRFLKVLVQDMNKYVAISEEIANDVSKKVKSGGLLFDRKVTRVITPGTLIDEHFMDPWENNYLLSIFVAPPSTSSKRKRKATLDDDTSPSPSSDQRIGLAWLDLSSGDFFTQTADISSLSSAVARIGPREVVVDSSLEKSDDAGILNTLKKDGYIVAFQPSPAKAMTVEDWTPMLEETVPDFNPSSFHPNEVNAGGALLQYVKTQLQGSTASLQAPVSQQVEDYMNIDKNTLKALELRSTLRDGKFEGSLLHTLKRTVTKSGTRLLTQRLLAPSMSLKVINERLDLVEGMLKNPALREDLVTHLARTFDTLRLVQKFSFGRGDADDLIELAKTIQTTSEIYTLLRAYSTHLQPNPADKSAELPPSFHSLMQRLSLEQPNKLSERIIEAIDEDGLSEKHRLDDSAAAEMVDMAQEIVQEEAEDEDLKALPKRLQPKKRSVPNSIRAIYNNNNDVWIMRPSASRTLEQLHGVLTSLEHQRDELEEELRTKFQAPSLTLKWTPSLGHICHVKGKDATRIASATGAKSVGSSKTTRSIHITEWTQLGGQIDETKQRIRSEEQRVLGELRAGVVQNLIKLRRNAAVLDELDVACSLAELAEEKNFVRPVLNPGTSHRITGGRHPVVEAGLTEQGKKFTSNDCYVGEDERIWLITGPNMAGKSTFLRQNALISILAQTGSFVPAEYAEIGLVDKIFSRVGSADNLYEDQSTFMVEMLETAQILKQATPRSFVIMDEVGRGTTPEDGIAVGYACLHHLHKVNKCRALFATHFHALVDMTRGFEAFGCYCTDVAEGEDGTFSYVHKLRRGVNRKSHALKVAKVAGLPEEAMAVAAEVLNMLKPGN